MSASRVLVVDDELQVRELLTEFLRSQGYEVREAQTAVEALAEARAWHPNVVLLDLNMPGAVRGETIVAPLSADAAVIVITGETDVELARQTLRDGAFDFVVKPFALFRVGEIVETAIAYGRGGGAS